MKKYLSLFILFLIFIHSGLASATTFFEPEWSDFCPPTMLNLNQNKKYIISSKNYWVERKTEFENKKAKCSQYSDAIEKSGCFEELRIFENTKNQNYFGMMQQRANNATMMNLIK